MNLMELIEEYRNKGIHITEDDIDKIYRICLRKMEIGRIENKRDYLPLIFSDEVKNFIIRQQINASLIKQKG